MKRVLALSFAVIVVASCAGDPPAVPPGATAGFPVVVDGVEVPTLPQRIVSLSASHTEMLYAIGAGDRVVATDLFSDFPPAALETEKVDAFNPSVEGIAGLQPDLVLLAFDPGDTAAGLGALGIPAIVFDAPRTLDDVYAQFADVGRVVGLEDAAEGVVGEMRSDISGILASMAVGDPVTYYHELDGQLFTVTSDTFLGHLYSLLGMVNVADPADEEGYGYPQLSAEYLLGADPDVILLGDTKCCGQSAATVAARPGWSELTAVREGHVIELDDDVASRWGPRVVDFLSTVADALHRVGVAR